METVREWNIPNSRVSCATYWHGVDIYITYMYYIMLLIGQWEII